MQIKSLTIYCASSNKLKKEYFDLATKIGVFLAKNNVSVVYGGGNNGLMGKISNSAYNSGGKVIGIIPEFLKKGENVNYNISELIVVESMQERKKMLFEKGDAFLVLPGGSGTIEEATEIISWKFLGLHSKQIFIFNFKNYWKPLLDLYNNSKIQKFTNINLQTIYKDVRTLKEFKSFFNSCQK